MAEKYAGIAKGKPMKASDMENALDSKAEVNIVNTLAFFPKGAILMFSSEAWNATSTAFKTIWKICNGQGGTPNLINKFLRGGASSDFAIGGGADTVALTKENLPKHAHTVVDKGHKHTEHVIGNSGTYYHEHGGIKTDWATALDKMDTSTDTANISVGDTFPNQTDYARAFSVVPSYFTVIYIMKVA
ncbi:MAG: hypothetical protein LBK68_00395 [Candidatus Margulisbacteria bacterium]|jgi:hypothetical protein|nr:hypothetical protein [Candidatus Margulisiibacteriota bacterium]